VQSLQASGGSITTSANQGNGGSVSISGQGPLWLDHSNITTSVTGTSGNGGDINIDVPYVVLNTGAIQSNTAASHASGGNLTIDAQAVIPTYESFILGGNAVRFDPASEGLNVVQAAAPDGVSGVLAVTEPTLDLGNSMTGLVGKPSTPTVLGRSPCSYRRGSSLSVAGRGGLPISARDPLWIDAHDFINERAINDSVPATDNNDAPPLPFANSSIHGCR
jgi:large exoprotein involved in heme utilization and adhesion